jgi:hypothetical protein
VLITIPRVLILGLAAVVSAFHIVLGAYSLGHSASAILIFVALALYGAATVASLWPSSPTSMSASLGAFNLAVCVALPILVTSQLDPANENGYATWYVAAVGTLMTITVVRRRKTFAWLGVTFLVMQSAAWAGPAALPALGVIGSVVWVGMTHVLTIALAKAEIDALQFVSAEREAAEWQAAQEAHVSERTVRLGQIYTISAPMLREIIDQDGDLAQSKRQECLYLEAAIRDEIRGRTLLNDRVRDRVMAARRRGATVTLLDEGGLDDLGPAAVHGVLGQLATAIEHTGANRIIARTVPEGSETAVTVVGLVSRDDGMSALGHDTSDDEVALWLEIPRPGHLAK